MLSYEISSRYGMKVNIHYQIKLKGHGGRLAAFTFCEEESR
jgi:hypothetical protein